MNDYAKFHPQTPDSIEKDFNENAESENVFESSSGGRSGKFNFFMTSTNPDENIKFHLPDAKLILQFEQFETANAVLNWLNSDPSHKVRFRYQATGTWRGNVVGKLKGLTFA